MSKAAPRIQKGAEFDMREAAQEAARREGLSLGEWMTRAIADQLGEPAAEGAPDDAETRLEAVAAELARLSREASGEAASARAARRDEPFSLQTFGTDPMQSATTRDASTPEPSALDDFAAQPTRRAGAETPLAAPGAARAAFFESRVASVLAQIDIRLADIERRLRRGEGAALISLRDAMAALQDRLGEIETAMARQNLNGEDRPLRAMLVRLEHRVEALSRQGGDEQAALARLETRLQNLLDGLTASRPAALRGGVAAAIDAIAARQRALETAPQACASPAPSRPESDTAMASPAAPALTSPALTSPNLTARAPTENTQSLQRPAPDIGSTSASSDAQADATRPRLDALGGEVARMAARLAERAPRADVVALEQALTALSARIAASIASGAEPAPAALARLESQIGSLSERLDHMVATLQERDPAPWSALTMRLDQLSRRLDEPRPLDQAAVEGLARRLDDLRAAVDARPAADVGPALAGLEQKIGALAERFERDGGRAEEARNARDISDLRARAAASDRLTQQSLSAVQETLEKVVDRLAMIEEDVVSARPAPPRAALAEISEHFLVEPGAGRPEISPQRPAEAQAALDKNSASVALDDAERPLGLAVAPAETPIAVSTKAGFGPSEADAEIFPPVNYIEIARRALAARAAAEAADRVRPAVGAADGAKLAAATVEQAAPTAPKSETVAASASSGEKTMAAPKPAQAGGWRGPAAFCAALSVVSVAGWSLWNRPSEPPPMAHVADHVADAHVADALSPPTAARIGAGDANAARSDAAAPAPAIPPSATTMDASASLDAKNIAAAPKIAGADMSPTGSIAGAAPSRQNGFAAFQAGVEILALKERAQQGDARAQYDFGLRLAEGRGVSQDQAGARDWFEKSADAGFAPAQYRLGAFYEKGVFGPRDAQKAVDYYQRAAMQGHVRAMHNLAVVLAEGVDGKPDYAAAAQWFRRAAEYGLRDSQYNLAVLYGRGLGAPQDFAQSYLWFALAAAQGDEEAARKRDELAARLAPAELDKAKKAVAEFRAKTPDPAINGQPFAAAAKNFSRG